MTAYRRILAAIDLTEHSRAVAQRACELASSGPAAVQLLHVVEFAPVTPPGDDILPVVQIDQELMERAQKQIVALARELNIATSATRVEVGSARSEILRLAQEQASELIVIGARERHGLSLLVPHTEDSVLHGAPCDVLAVRVP
jgi:universal stress protein A